MSLPHGMLPPVPGTQAPKHHLSSFLWGVVAVLLPLVIGITAMHAWHRDLSIPFIYPVNAGDETWQLILSKALSETGWVLTNPHLGAPAIAQWHHNAAAQTSPLHSVVLLVMSLFIHDPIRLQQVYSLLSFGLIGGTSFWACRSLGIARPAAVSVGLLFSVLTYRWDNFLYSFISNYWAVPLGMVAVYRCVAGEYNTLTDGADRWGTALSRVLRSPRFWGGWIGVILVTASDGYYAFFMLLLLAFSAICRVLAGDWRKPRRLLVPALYGASLLALSLALAAPLALYKASHRDEFFPGGVEDPTLVKHAFEAEVYAPSFKMLLTPWPNHHWQALARIGARMQAASDEARKYPVGLNYTLGALGGVLLLVFLGRLVRSSLIEREPSGTSAESSGYIDLPMQAVMSATSVLALFILLTCISGGIGALIAMVFPTIRAYYRFPLFLSFVLLCGAAAWWTIRLPRAGKRGRMLLYAGLVVVSALSVFDEIPPNMHARESTIATQFLAERAFVRKLEADVGPGTMVYAYPHSQYLANSPHYGWGSFAHLRLYLHSKDLRWNGGGAKNSPVDDWHTRTAALDAEDMLTELQAVGFRAFVVDRRVITGPAWENIQAALVKRGAVPIENDPASQYAYAKLPDPGYRLLYDPTFREPVRIEITDRKKLSASAMSVLIRREPLMQLIGAMPELTRIERAEHPGVFFDGADLDRGTGASGIRPLDAMKGALRCTPRGDGVDLTLRNDTTFKWRLNSGRFPLRIGTHVYAADGSMKAWDEGIRVPMSGLVQPGGDMRLHFSWDQLPKASAARLHGTRIEFAVLQDDYAWFGQLACTVATPSPQP